MRPSFVMLDDNAVDDLFFHAFVLSRLQLALAIGAGATLSPFFHGWRTRTIKSTCHSNFFEDGAIGEGNQLHRVVGESKVEEPESCPVPLIRRGLYNTVDRRLVEPARQELQGVAGVDHL